jgi:uncharacterized protein YndB with AHSA1/START domain
VLLRHFAGKATAVVFADPDHVFACLTDVAGLPEWNRRIAAVMEAPAGSLAEGVVWRVQMSVPPSTTWVSRACVLSYDPSRRLFRHRSQSDDGNPTYLDWSWEVSATAAGSRVIVRWDAHVATFWRQLLFAKLRRRQLVEEVASSLDALAYRVAVS